MKLELSIADDRELRSFIKDSIKSEIVSIARGEVKSILADVIKEGVLPKDQATFDRILRDEIEKEVRSVLKSSGWSNQETIKVIAREEISKFIKELVDKKDLV